MMTDPLPTTYRTDIALGVILSLITCGIYNVIWNKKQMEALNRLLGEEVYSFSKWLVFSLLTCGLYHIYYEYKMGRDLAAILQARGRPNENLPLYGLALSLCGLTVIVDAIYQQELNAMIE